MLRSSAALLAVALALPQTYAAVNHKYQPIDTNYPVPAENVLWVAADAPAGGDGSRDKPLDSIRTAVQRATDGTTIILKSGAYREPHFFVTKNHITLQAEPHGDVWLKGSTVVPAERFEKEGNLWKVTGDFQNFCHVCTLSADPALAKMSAYPEQVFINDEPLRQVLSKNEVTAGTFYVEDKTPTTLKDPKNNRAGYNIGEQDEITYYLGSDPASGTVEISERSRAFSTYGRKHHFTMRGINISQFSPNHVWNFKDPRLDDKSGPAALVVASSNSLVENGIFAQNTSSALAIIENNGSRVAGNRFVDNGGAGTGGNYAHNVVFENNYFANNNLDGYPTNGTICQAYCGFAHLKITHVVNTVFRNNIIDDSMRPPTTDPANRNEQLPGFWCDEGCIDAKITNNFFTNVPLAIFYEVSDRGIIASNIIENGAVGISLSGSSNTRVYNNTISRTFHPIRLREDDRLGGCNQFRHGKCEIEEKWSKGKNLSWAQTGTEIYNNILSSRAFQPQDSGGPHYAYPLRTVGGIDQDGQRKTFTNDMFKGLDYNAYYRSSLQNEPYVITWDLPEVDNPLNLLFVRTADLAAHGKVNKKINGLERHALDLFGSRAENPFFVHEAAGNQDYKQSNYQLRADSPAKGSGKALPLDIARAIDPSGSIKSGVAVDRGALMNIMMDATGGAAAPERTTAAHNQRRHSAAPAAAHRVAQGATVNTDSGIANAGSRTISDNPALSYYGMTGNAGGGTGRQRFTIINVSDNASAIVAATRSNMGVLPDNRLPHYRYDRIRPYSEGMAAVEKNGRWGFIDQKGREIVRPQYQDVLPYGESRAAVKKGNQWGFIDKHGKETVKPQYDTVWSYKDGRATVQKDGKRHALDINGNPINTP
ncbi:WG repeat-containing protein [uncultured Cardiobacterium sp.]|uniref:WG repeat-containing protein n=1 Tax=uncultured Cardiobacterium sp. TaxID=417619 RepID=UPI002603C1B4|nr:WG repeat-containing protein [uncultured Cardiobacterium sp.]